MPAQTGKSVLAAKLGQKLVQAQAEHKGREPEVGNPQLPAGIEGGVAQLVMCQIGTFKQGQNTGMPFFQAQAVVKTPAEHAGQRCAGLRTQIGPEALCDTPTAGGQRKTFSEHYGWMRDNLMILGLNIDELSGTPEQIEQQILTGMQALVQAAPYFHFRTWKGKKQDVAQDTDGKFYLFDINDDGTLGARVQGKGSYPSLQVGKANNKYAGQEPRVVHEWNGACEYNEPDATQTQMAGVTETQPSLNGAGGGGSGSAVATAAGDGEPFSEFGDVDSLVAAAKAGDAGAATKLQQMAVAAGHTEQAVVDAPDWDAVAAMCVTPANGVEEAPAEELAAAKVPSKGEIWKFHPIDAKTKKPAAKPVDAEILTVDAEKCTATIKRLDTKGMVKGVSFDALSAG